MHSQIGVHSNLDLLLGLGFEEPFRVPGIRVLAPDVRETKSYSVSILPISERKEHNAPVVSPDRHQDGLSGRDR